MNRSVGIEKRPSEWILGRVSNKDEYMKKCLFLVATILFSLSGFAASVTVFASAVGPAAFSLGYDFFGSYGAAVKMCIGLLSLFLIAAVVIDQQEVSHE